MKSILQYRVFAGDRKDIALSSIQLNNNASYLPISLRRITETGLLTYNLKTWMGHKPKCEKSSVDVVPVDLLHFSSALYVPFVGPQVSVVILFAEIFVSRYQGRFLRTVYILERKVTQ